MAASPRPRGPRPFAKWLRLLREMMPHTVLDLPAFVDSHKQHAFISSAPLYALSPALLASARTELSHWLTTDEFDFETALLELCQRHGCIGFFRRRPIQSFLVSRPPAPVIDAATFKTLKWEAYYAGSKVHQLASSAGAAYRAQGWRK